MFIICAFLIIIGLAIYLCSLCVYKVEYGTVAVIGSFDEYKRTEKPGLHFKKPWESIMYVVNTVGRTLDFRPKEVPILEGGEGEVKGEVKVTFDGEILYSVDSSGANVFALFEKTGLERDNDPTDDSDENKDINGRTLSPVEKALADQAGSFFANIVANMKYSEITSKKEEIASQVLEKLRESSTTRYGVNVENFMLKNVAIAEDEELKKANHDAFIQERRSAADYIAAENDRRIRLLNAQTDNEVADLEAKAEQKKQKVKIIILQEAKDAGVGDAYLQKEALATYQKMSEGDNKILIPYGINTLGDLAGLFAGLSGLKSSEDTAEKEEKEDTEE